LLLIESLTSSPLGEEGNSDDMLTTDDISNLKELYSDVWESNVSLHEDILPQCLQKLNHTSSQIKFQLAKIVKLQSYGFNIWTTSVFSEVS